MNAQRCPFPSIALAAALLLPLAFTARGIAAQTPDPPGREEAPDAPESPEAPREDSACFCFRGGEAWTGAWSEEMREGLREARERLGEARIRIPELPFAPRAPLRPRFGLQLTDLNPELGRYFERDSGALVLQVRPDAPLALQAGDVIISIDGREVRDAAHAASILRSYQPGEEVTLGVWREGREVSLRGETPEARPSPPARHPSSGRSGRRPLPPA